LESPTRYELKDIDFKNRLYLYQPLQLQWMKRYSSPV